jgi:hypothetical protein
MNTAPSVEERAPTDLRQAGAKLAPLLERGGQRHPIGGRPMRAMKIHSGRLRWRNLVSRAARHAELRRDVMLKTCAARLLPAWEQCHRITGHKLADVLPHTVGPHRVRVRVDLGRVDDRVTYAAQPCCGRVERVEVQARNACHWTGDVDAHGSSRRFDWGWVVVGDQLGPDAVPVVGAQIAARDGAGCGLLNAGAVLGRDEPTTVEPVPYVLLLDSKPRGKRGLSASRINRSLE